MNKKFKRFAGIVCGATLALSAFALSACGEKGDVLYDGFGSDYIVTHENGQEVTYTLEAEYTNVENKSGTAFSGERSGTNMIVAGDSTASNGYAIAGLCKKGLSINFVIVCDRDVEDATLILRVGNEEVANAFFTITSESFLIRVDPVSEYDVDSYKNGGAWGMWDEEFLAFYDDDNPEGSAFKGYYVDTWDCGDISFAATSSDPSGFEDWTVTANLKLSAGLNCISLITNNSDVPSNTGSNGSTLFATAPVVDCIKIKTDAQIGLYNPQSNDHNLDLSKACTFK